MSYTNEESPEFIALFNGKFNPAKEKYTNALKPEFLALFNGHDKLSSSTAQSRDDFIKEIDKESADVLNAVLGRPTLFAPVVKIEKVISTDIIHTRKSREKMGQSGVTQQEVIETINDSSKVNQNDTILCNGRRINVRLVKKEEKYLVIDVYVN
jgi:hypothetical protein